MYSNKQHIDYIHKWQDTNTIFNFILDPSLIKKTDSFYAQTNILAPWGWGMQEPEQQISSIPAQSAPAGAQCSSKTPMKFFFMFEAKPLSIFYSEANALISASNPSFCCNIFPLVTSWILASITTALNNCILLHIEN